MPKSFDEQLRDIIFRKVFPRLKHQDMTPADFYGIHYQHNEQFCQELVSQLKSLFLGLIPEESLPPMGSLEDKYGYLAGQRKGFNLCRQAIEEESR